MNRFDITIAGEINLDLILYGLPDPMPTERELLAEGFAMTLGSSSAILAHNLAALSTKVGFITRAGDDPFGAIALERLDRAGVDLSRVVRPSGAASGVTLILPHARERHILTYAGTISELRFEDLDLEYLTSARHFHMSSLFLHKALREHVPEIFRRMKKAGLTTSLDTNDDPDDRWGAPLDETLAYVDVLLPNEREAMKIAKTDDLDTAARRLAERVPRVVIKLGSRGAMAVQDGKCFKAPAAKVEVVDSVGAGDSFDAGFLHQFLRGSDLHRCLSFANLCGAFSTSASGGTEAFRNLPRLREFLRGES